MHVMFQFWSQSASISSVVFKAVNMLRAMPLLEYIVHARTRLASSPDPLRRRRRKVWIGILSSPPSQRVWGRG